MRVCVLSSTNDHKELQKKDSFVKFSSPAFLENLFFFSWF